MTVSKSRKARMAAGLPGRRQSTKEKTMAVKRWIADNGLEPLTVMLDNMADAHHRAAELDDTKDQKLEIKRKTYRAIAQHAAAEAAPYVHQKLATTTLVGDPDAPVGVTIINNIPRPKGRA